MCDTFIIFDDQNSSIGCRICVHTIIYFQNIYFALGVLVLLYGFGIVLVTKAKALLDVVDLKV